MNTLNNIVMGMSHVKDGEFLEEHPFRALMLDADGVIYHIAHPHLTVEKNFKELVNYIEYLRRCAGAQWVFTFTTMALKGGREQMAYYQKYQKKRHDHRTPELAQRVTELRMMLHNYQTDTIFPKPQWFLEADEAIGAFHLQWVDHYCDGMSSVIGTGDKDLDMYPGIVMNIKTRKFTYCGDYAPRLNDDNTIAGAGAWYNNYGHVKYYKPNPKKQGKLVGRGTAFFWGQMLCGDTADTIAGLPKMNGFLLDRYKPLQRKTSGRRPDSPCGASLAATVLSHCSSDKNAYRAVSEAYQGYFGKDWRFFFFENAFLLWMRRTDQVLDVMNFLGQQGFEYDLHPQQKQALVDYQQACMQILGGTRA